MELTSMMKLGWVAGLVVIAMGCKTQKEKAIDDLVEDAEKVVLPNIKAAIASGDLDGAIPCTRITANVYEIEKTGDHDELVADIKQTCDHDWNVARMKRAVEQAEAARKKKPDEKVMQECYSGELTASVDRLKRERLYDAPAEALMARFAVACPERDLEE